MAAFLFPKPLSDVSPQLLLIINGMLMPPVGAVGGGAVIVQICASERISPAFGSLDGR